MLSQILCILLVWACKGDAAVARGQVENWAKRWQGHRECLVGVAPVSADVEEAIALRAVVDTRFAEGVKACGPFASELARGSSEHSGSTAIEAKWLDLEHAVERLDKAHAAVVSGESEPVRLARAADAVERHYAALRKLTGLPPDVMESTPIPEMPDVPLIAGLDGVPVRGHWVADDNAVVVRETGSGIVTLTRVTGPTPQDVRVTRYDQNAILATDDVAWGAWMDDAGRLVSGPFAADGARLPGAAVVGPRGSDFPGLAIGRGANRWVVRTTFADDGPVVIVSQSDDAGIHWTDLVLSSSGDQGNQFFFDSDPRRMDVTYEEGNTWVWRSLRGDLSRLMDPQPILPAGVHYNAPTIEAVCFSDTNAWWAVRDMANDAYGDMHIAFSSSDPATPPTMPKHASKSTNGWLCRDDVLAIVESDDKLVVTMCRPDGCAVVLDDEQPLDRIAMLFSEERGLVVAGFVGELLLVHRPYHKSDGHRLAFRVPHLELSLGLVEWDGRIYAVIGDEHGIKAMPIPLP